MGTIKKQYKCKKIKTTVDIIFESIEHSHPHLVAAERGRCLGCSGQSICGIKTMMLNNCDFASSM